METTTFVFLTDPQLGQGGGNIKDLSAVNKALNSLGWGPYSKYPTNQNLSCGGAPMSVPQAVFFAGDMCQWGGLKNIAEQANLPSCNPANYQGGQQLKDVRALYDPWHTRSGIVPLNKCGYLYFGLGNHDFQDGDPGSGWRYFNNTYSPISDFYRYQMWDFIAQMHTGFLNHSRGPRFGIAPDKIDSDKNGSYEWKNYSMNYFVDLGPVDVYQLHRYGGDADWGRETGLDWLKRNLALRGYKRPVIIVQHFLFSDWYEMDTEDSPSGVWTLAKLNHLYEILLPYNVLAVCVGHKHYPQGNLPNMVPVGWDAKERAPFPRPWPNERKTLPSSYVKPKLAEIRPGAALDHFFGLFRVQGGGATGTATSTTVDILFGTQLGSGADAVSIDWTAGWSLAALAPPSLYVRDIEIVFMENADENTVLLPTLCTEISGQSSDINKDFGGNYVYIRPLLTNDPSDAITKVTFWTSKTADASYQNLAKGCSGDFRYVKTSKEAGKTPITGLFLLRRSSAQTIQNYEGWADMTADINQGRGRTYLYLIWRTWTDYAPATTKKINGH